MSSQANSPYSIPSHNTSKLSNRLPPPESVAASSTNLQSQFSNPNDFITYIIPDFNAVKYFQKEFLASNEFHLIEESEVTGFEIYLVEQWVNDRNISSIVTAFTGNEASKISVMRFTIIKKPAKYYPVRFQEYLNELIQNHSRMKKMEKDRPKNFHSRTSSAGEMLTLSKLSTTPSIPVRPPSPKRENSTGDYTNEVCFVTNLTSLPSTLNLIPIPSGDVRKVEVPFMVNSNLKKLQCTGRSISMTSNKISDASEDKFRQMYKIYNTKVPILFAAKELVNIVQTCLFYFDLLDARYCDGLLCAKTEEALMNWWNLIGLPHFNVKPNPVNGILPARTVAAVVSLILSVRMRMLLVGGSDVPKDPFDFENFMIAIGQFQRQFKLDKSRKLDMETLNKMFTVTNARLLPEKNSNYFYSTAYNSSADFDPQDYDIGQAASSAAKSIGGSSTALASTPQKRRYGKELKKLTNVMKSSVLPSTRDMDDNSIAAQKATSGRIRNKIAKFADMVTPLDVETLDLESLVKNNLAGKTLIRLFYGVQNNQVFAYVDRAADHNNPNQADRHRHTHATNHPHLHFQKRRGRTMVDDANSQYGFESLRDRIAQTQELVMNNDPSKYSRGFSKMKLGLQSRKNIANSSKADTTLTVTGENGDSKEVQPASMVDSFLQIHSDNASCTESVSSNSNSIPPKCAVTDNDFSHPISKFKHNLNRRNSFPYLIDQHEENLNTLLISKSGVTYTPEQVHLARSKRSISFSCVEDVVLARQITHIGSMTKFSQSYLESINALMRYENLRTYYVDSDVKTTTHVNNAAVNKSYQLMNLELIKLKNIRNQMVSNKAREESMHEELDYNMKLLATTIDRLFYETRIVTKRISELEENFKLYELKLHDDCNKRMAEIIDRVLHLKQFREVYSDPEERNNIALKLTGNDHYFTKTDENEKPMSFLRCIAIFFYELVLCVFQFFQFNRENMNLDRIRESWAKLDPNRSILKGAYSYIGREPAQDIISSSSTVNPK
ncbi:Protein STB2 [Candida viswanathii]|uniref:Protein STB2 n=1 Tax=Candida viswanathii TaxID=5486 RepID=A0A367YIP8_9ASCO|nr:Protein STB2 [Candida viswanathii]